MARLMLPMSQPDPVRETLLRLARAYRNGALPFAALEAGVLDLVDYRGDPLAWGLFGLVEHAPPEHARLDSSRGAAYREYRAEVERYVDDVLARDP